MIVGLRSLASVVSAAVCVVAFGLVAPASSAEGIGKGQDVQGCDDVLVQVSKAKKLDGVVVAKGVYGLGVDGISCDEAENLVEDWVDSGRVNQGFDAVEMEDDSTGASNAIVFEDDQDTKRSSDDEEIVLVKAKFLSCAFTKCPLGSTVTINNQSGIRTGTYPDITVSNTETRPTPVTLAFGQTVRYSNKPSGTTTDLSISANAVGSAAGTNTLQIVAYSSSLNGGEVCLIGPAPRSVPATMRSKPSRALIGSGDQKCVSPSVGSETYFSFRDANRVPDQVRGFVRRMANEENRYTWRVTLYLTN